MLALKAGTLITPNEVLKESFIVIDKGKIVQISKSKPDNMRVHDYGDSILSPGFVDIHTHGSFGIDIMNASQWMLSELACKLPTAGVTSFFPSTVTDNFSRLKEALQCSLKASKAGKGANILGVHLEGPYLNVEKKGAQMEEYIRAPSFEEFSELFKAGEGLLKRITVAPDVAGSIEFIEKVIKNFDVTVSLGHTNATYDQTRLAFDCGAKLVTHLFNGMRELHHREPGIVGAALIRDDVFTEAIVDLVHLHPATVMLIYRCKSAKRMVLVTDSTAGAGLPDGSYKLGPVSVVIKDGVSRLADGALAGSTLTMIKAVQNAVKIGVSVGDAIAMATSTPCKALKIRGKGEIAVGCDADLLVLDKQLNIRSTYINGEVFKIN